jgi:hypothetical protein
MQGSVTKIGLWGGQAGSQQDLTVPPKRLQSLTIPSGNAIDSIQFTYTDKAGQKHTAGPWGGFGGTPQTVSEFFLSFGFFFSADFFPLPRAQKQRVLPNIRPFIYRLLYISS